MQPGSVQFLCRGVFLGAVLALLAVPAWAQQACTTEVFLYVDKTDSVNARRTAEEVLNWINPVPPGGVQNLGNVTIFGFTGAVPVSTSMGTDQFPMDVPRVLDRVILREPSSAFTLAPDYLALFNHIEVTAQERPTVATLRTYIVISDFSMRRGEAAHEGALPAALLERLANLRRTLVMRGNQRLIAIRTAPREEPSPALSNDLLGEIAHNFVLVEEASQITKTLEEVFGEPPLLLELGFDAQTSVYNLTVANPSCVARQNIQYWTIASGIDNRLTLPTCPVELRPRETGTCQFTRDQLVLPPLVDTCLNVWLRAATPVQAPPAAAAAATELGEIIGTANDPILAGNCVFLSRADLDSTKSLATAEDLAECRRVAGAAGAGPEAFIACLRLRGRVEDDSARLQIRRGPGATEPLIVDESLRALQVNGAAFHGGERIVPVVFPLPGRDASWLCTPEADLAERRLPLQIVGTGGISLASGVLGRVLPPNAEDPLALWRKLLAPLLILLFLSGFMANYMKTASLGMLDAVLLILGLGLLVLLFAAYGGTGVGLRLSSLFGASSLVVATIGIGLLALCYWLLFARGFFDRQLTALGRASVSLRTPLADRRRQRSLRTWLAMGLALVLIASTIVLLWINPREVSECRYQLTDLPTNTAVPPFNQPVVGAAPAP